MRRLLIPAATVALLVLMTAPQASAAAGRPFDRVAQHALVAPVPRDVTGGPLTVSGTVLSPTGAPVAGADVEWGYYNGGRWVYGSAATTDSTGRYTFTGVIAASTGTIDVYPASSDDAWGIGPVTFSSTPVAGAYDVKPGRVTLTNTDRTGVQYTDIRAYTSGATGYCRTIITSQSAEVAAMPPSVNYACARYRDRLGLSMGGVEWTGGPIAVTSGTLATTGITVDEHNASWVYITSPYWGSGPPGSRIRLVADNWRSPMRATFTGYPGYPENASPVDYSTTLTATDGTARILTLTVPKSAKPGYAFDIETHRSDAISANGGESNLYLTAGFEVCTLKASRTVVTAGSKVTLGGIVPTQGHQGSTKGDKKAVVLYSRTTKPSGPPTAWNATKKGWKKELSFKSNGYGAYSASGHLSRTKWFVVRYDGDDWYYGGYTAVVKVTVR